MTGLRINDSLLYQVGQNFCLGFFLKMVQKNPTGLYVQPNIFLLSSHAQCMHFCWAGSRIRVYSALEDIPKLFSVIMICMAHGPTGWVPEFHFCCFLFMMLGVLITHEMQSHLTVILYFLDID